MHTYPALAKTMSYYNSLLIRYALRYFGNGVSASPLVIKVLADKYEHIKLGPSKKLRLILKHDLLNHCYFHKHFAALDRPPIKVPLSNNIQLPYKIITPPVHVNNW